MLSADRPVPGDGRVGMVARGAYPGWVGGYRWWVQGGYRVVGTRWWVPGGCTGTGPATGS